MWKVVCVSADHFLAFISISIKVLHHHQPLQGLLATLFLAALNHVPTDENTHNQKTTGTWQQ